jgi:hypothetical protein
MQIASDERRAQQVMSNVRNSRETDRFRNYACSELYKHEPIVWVLCVSSRSTAAAPLHPPPPPTSRLPTDASIAAAADGSGSSSSSSSMFRRHRHAPRRQGSGKADYVR